MDQVNEGTTSYLTVTFTNKAGIAEAPSSATWEAIDKRSGEVMQAATAITPAGTVEITIPSTVNAILEASLDSEIRRITVKASYGVSDEVTGQFDYKVINLSRVP